MNQENVTPQVTILLADDHAIWRGGVRSLLEDSEFQVVGEASSGRETGPHIWYQSLNWDKLELESSTLEFRHKLTCFVCI